MLHTLITPAELASRLGHRDSTTEPPLLIVDVSHDLGAPDSWGEARYREAHLPGAVFAHLDRDLSGPKTGRNGRHPLPSREIAASVFGRLGIDHPKQVVAYDQNNGIYASRLWWMLRWLGHDAVAVLEGGFARWEREGLAIASGWQEPTSAQFTPASGAQAVTVADIEANLESRQWLVIDARAGERYRGEVEPLDHAAGHIPDAINRPYTENFDVQGRFKPPHVLHQEFERLLGGRAPSTIVHQCGSGITACHNLLAMAHAGMEPGMLYPGSWSEWSADPGRPMHQGAEP